jgi:hypothetical protein
MFSPIVDEANEHQTTTPIDTQALAKSEYRFWSRVWPTWKRLIDKAADSLMLDVSESERNTIS